MKCPTHNVNLVCCHTRYGPRWDCPDAECTVVCWGGTTSTPADQETRDLRKQCHAAFDPLWRDRIRFKTRDLAYKWLSKQMGIDKRSAHIGMFDAFQCGRLLGLLARKSLLNQQQAGQMIDNESDMDHPGNPNNFGHD